MKKLFFLFLVAFSLFACTQKDDRPSNILDKEKMTAVLVDVELLEAVVKQKLLDRKYPKQNMPIYYRQVMEKNGITYQQFRNSFDWWENHPQEFHDIYVEVNKRLEKMKEEIPEEKKEADKAETKLKKKSEK